MVITRWFLHPGCEKDAGLCEHLSHVMSKRCMSSGMAWVWWVSLLRISHEFKRFCRLGWNGSHGSPSLHTVAVGVKWFSCFLKCPHQELDSRGDVRNPSAFVVKALCQLIWQKDRLDGRQFPFSAQNVWLIMISYYAVLACISMCLYTRLGCTNVSNCFTLFDRFE